MQTRTAPRSNRPTRTLIVSADEQGYTTVIARGIGARLQSLGHHVDVCDAPAYYAPTPGDYDAVIFGTDHGARRDRRTLGSYIARHRERLLDLPTALFVVSRQRARADWREPIDFYKESIGWVPSFAARIECRGLGLARATLLRLARLVLRRLEISIPISSSDEINAIVAAIETAILVPHRSTTRAS